MSAMSATAKESSLPFVAVLGLKKFLRACRPPLAFGARASSWSFFSVRRIMKMLATMPRNAVTPRAIYETILSLVLAFSVSS